MVMNEIYEGFFSVKLGPSELAHFVCPVNILRRSSYNGNLNILFPESHSKRLNMCHTGPNCSSHGNPTVTSTQAIGREYIVALNLLNVYIKCSTIYYASSTYIKQSLFSFVGL